MFNQTLCALDHHLRHPLMVVRQLVKSGVDHFHIVPADGFLHIRYFLRALVNEQNQHVHVRIGAQNGFCHLLQKGGLSRLGRRDNHTALTLADGAYQIHNPHGHTAARRLQFNALIRKNRGHILKCPAFGGFFQGIAIDGADKKQRTELFLLCFDSLVTPQDIPRLQAETADLAGCHIHIVLAGEIVLTADKSITVRHYLQDTAGLLAAVQLLGICLLVVNFIGAGTGRRGSLGCLTPHCCLLPLLPLPQGTLYLNTIPLRTFLDTVSGTVSLCRPLRPVIPVIHNSLRTLSPRGAHTLSRPSARRNHAFKSRSGIVGSGGGSFDSVRLIIFRFSTFRYRIFRGCFLRPEAVGSLLCFPALGGAFLQLLQPLILSQHGLYNLSLLHAGRAFQPTHFRELFQLYKCQ